GRTSGWTAARSGRRRGRSPPDDSAGDLPATETARGHRSRSAVDGRQSLPWRPSRVVGCAGHTEALVLEEPPAPTAADDRDEFGRPKSALSWWQLLSVTAYWLAITTLWGAFTFSVIPRLVESKGVLGSSTHPLAGLAIGVITTAGVLIAILVQPTMGSISDHTRSRLGRRKPFILIGTAMDLLFLTFAAWAFWNQNYWAFVGAVALLQFSSNFAQGPYQGYIPDLVPGRQVGIASGLL